MFGSKESKAVVEVQCLGADAPISSPLFPLGFSPLLVCDILQRQPVLWIRIGCDADPDPDLGI